MRERREATSVSVAIAMQIEPPKSMRSAPSSRSISTASAWLAPLCLGAAHRHLGFDLRIMRAKAELGAAVRHQRFDALQQRIDMRLAEPIGMKALQPDRARRPAARQ